LPRSKLKLKGFIDLVPENINVSILVKESGKSIKLNDVINEVHKCRYKIIFIASRYNTYIIDRIRIEPVLKIVKHFESREIEYVY